VDIILHQFTKRVAFAYAPSSVDIPMLGVRQMSAVGK